MTTRRYAEGTAVSPEQSRMEIERTLKRYGADAILVGFDADQLLVRWRMNGRYLQRALDMPPSTAPAFANLYPVAAQKRAHEQETRRLWRVLLLWLKTTLEMVDSQVESFEIAFLPYILLPDGQTLGDFMQPQIDAAYSAGEMPRFLLPAGRG